MERLGIQCLQATGCVPHSVRIAVDSVVGNTAARFLAALVYHLPSLAVSKHILCRSLSPFARDEIDVETLMVLEVAACSVE